LKGVNDINPIQLGAGALNLKKRIESRIKNFCLLLGKILQESQKEN